MCVASPKKAGGKLIAAVLAVTYRLDFQVPAQLNLWPLSGPDRDIRKRGGRLQAVGPGFYIPNTRH